MTRHPTDHEPVSNGGFFFLCNSGRYAYSLEISGMSAKLTIIDKEKGGEQVIYKCAKYFF